jgi:hypothetical protein
MKYIIRNNKLYQFGVVRVKKIIQVPNSIYANLLEKSDVLLLFFLRS